GSSRGTGTRPTARSSAGTRRRSASGATCSCTPWTTRSTPSCARAAARRSPTTAWRSSGGTAARTWRRRSPPPRPRRPPTSCSRTRSASSISRARRSGSGPSGRSSPPETAEERASTGRAPRARERSSRPTGRGRAAGAARAFGRSARALDGPPAGGRARERPSRPTAARAGRLTLNPLPHIDPFGTVILPGLLYLFTHGALLFGYARPVPVDFGRLRHPGRDTVLVALAGPVTNLVLATASAFVLRMLPPPQAATAAAGFLRDVAFGSLTVNCVLAVFNLIPVPPLDGGRVLTAF